MSKIMKPLSLALVVMLAALAAVSCAKPPTAEVEAAKAAVARAEQDKDAQVYAPDSLRRATDALARMDAELQAKRYDAVKALAAEAGQAADKAIADGKANKERVKTQATSLSGAVKAALAELDTALAAAKKVRGVKLDFKALDAEVAAQKDAAAAAEGAIGKGEFKQAADAFQAIQARVADIQARIAEAVRAVSKKK